MGCPLARVPPTYGSTPRGECWTLLRREVALLVPPGQTRVLEAADHINKLAVRAARFLERHDGEAGNAWWLASALDTLRGLVQKPCPRHGTVREAIPGC